MITISFLYLGRVYIIEYEREMFFINHIFFNILSQIKHILFVDLGYQNEK